jgi:hypothetical protein
MIPWIRTSPMSLDFWMGFDCGGVIAIFVGDDCVVGPFGLATEPIAKCWVGRRASVNVVSFTSGLTPVSIASMRWLELLCSFPISSLPIFTSTFANGDGGSGYRHFVLMNDTHNLFGLPMVGNHHFYLAFEMTPNVTTMSSSPHLLLHPLWSNHGLRPTNPLSQVFQIFVCIPYWLLGQSPALSSSYFQLPSRVPDSCSLLGWNGALNVKLKT